MQPIADAIGAALEVIEGLRIHTYIPDAIEPPAIAIDFPSVLFDVDMSGDCIATFPVHLLIARSSDRAAYKNLSPYLVPDGVRAAILADPTLGGIVTSTRVNGVTVQPKLSVAGQDFLSANFSVEVFFGSDVIEVIGYGAQGYGV